MFFCYSFFFLDSLEISSPSLSFLRFISVIRVYPPVNPRSGTTRTRITHTKQWSEMGLKYGRRLFFGFGFFGPNPTETDP
jgi:hypothetical protein